MKPMYVLFFTYFRNGRALSRHRFFETKEKLYIFLLFHPQIGDNCIIFKNVGIKEDLK